ncbi:MAG: outer membrane protein assembly factor BamA [Nitrospirae bacterium]|nr:outer membrane protein assembly factor BamA [Nitrospirota bacterium]
MRGNRRTGRVPAAGRFARSLFAILLVKAMLLFLTAAPASASGPAIEKIGVEGLVSIGREELLDLLGLRVGEVLDPLKVREGIKRAFLKGIFEDIEVYADAERTGVKIVVKERDRIREVCVAGNEFFSDRQIRKLFLLKEGELLRYNLFDEAAKRLKEVLEERGFPHAEISLSVSPTSGRGEKTLTVTVDEGKPLRVERITVQGAPEEEVRGVMHLDAGDIYDLRTVKKDVGKIREHYKELGYLNPGVSYRFSEGSLMLDVNRGKRLEIAFEGNSVFNEKRLMKEMPFSEAGEVRDDLVEEAVGKITSLYYGKGYAFVQVAPVVSGKEGDTVEISFFIFEGERVEVGALNFPGMTLHEKNLKEALPMREGDDYNPDLLSSDVDVVREFYIALGYLSVEAASPQVRIEDGKALITIPVKEGPKTIIEKIEITGVRLISPADIEKAIALRQGEPYNEVDIGDARIRVIDSYQEKGFLDAAVNPKVEFSDDKALITFAIQEGEKTFFGKTVVTGNRKTKREVIARELLHKESAPFNPGVLVKERQRLLKLGLFTDVRMQTLERYDHRRDVLIEVVEGDAGSVEFGFGYNNFDKFTGFVDIGYKNLFGMNRQVSLRVGYNSLEKLYAVNYLDPWFLEKPLALKATVFLNERDEKNIDTRVVMYHYRRRGLSLGVEKQYSSAIKGELYYEYVFAKTTDVQPDMILTDKDTGKLGISSLRPGITYDTRDNPFDPRNGVLAGLTVKVASSALFSQTNFAKAVFNGSIYHELSKHFVAAAAFRLGVARAWDSSEILPLGERFFLGGRNSVRGYAQDTLGPRGALGDPTGGNAFVETNLELRTYLGKGIGLVTFLDSGNVWQKVGDISGTLKHAVGLGVRYNTPVGPLRVDYGYKLKKEEGLSRGEIFFSIGQAF